MKRAYGFTVVELLVVIVVIGVLAGISVVGYGSYREVAIQTRAQAEVQDNLKRVQKYMIENQWSRIDKGWLPLVFTDIKSDWRYLIICTTTHGIQVTGYVHGYEDKPVSYFASKSEIRQVDLKEWHLKPGSYRYDESNYYYDDQTLTYQRLGELRQSDPWLSRAVACSTVHKPWLWDWWQVAEAVSEHNGKKRVDNNLIIDGPAIDEVKF